MLVIRLQLGKAAADEMRTAVVKVMNLTLRSLIVGRILAWRGDWLSAEQFLILVSHCSN